MLERRRATQGARPCSRASRERSSTREVDKLEWPEGVGPKLKQMLHRGVGVHHAGLLPKYRRVVEDLFSRKLLAVCVCTETLAAGINLPARSVVLSSLVKGPLGKEKLIDPARPSRSSAAPAGRSSTTRATSTRWPTRTTCGSCAGRRSTTRSPKTRATRA